ncbi:hypothetical protein B0H13DRAFT_1863234 [Mycena leptocephala]|nr:hypothetical protein B0H13DRAFT_1863234 [Mycena leptocephala]
MDTHKTEIKCMEDDQKIALMKVTKTTHVLIRDTETMDDGRRGTLRIPGKNKVHDRTVSRAGVDEGGTVGGGQSHYCYLPHQPFGNGVLVSSNPFSSFEEDPKEGSLVAMDEPHIKIVKVGVHIGVQVDGLDVRLVLRVAGAAGRKGDLEAHEAGARLEGRIVARA